MKIFYNISSFRAWRESQNVSVGFVPTLGGLHQGHFSLIKKSNSLSTKTVVSLFLNPKQFNKNEDLKTYPSFLKTDLKKLTSLNVSAVFVPKTKEIYPKSFSIKIEETFLSNCLEGLSRPGFFSGIITIIIKLFNIVEPHFAFFGKKDPQQLLLIKKLCFDLNYKTKIIACPTIREKNGLALSSRNNYLSVAEKKDASVIYQSIQHSINLLNNNVFSIKTIKKEMKKILLSCPNLQIDYISFSDASNLLELKSFVKPNSLISVAVFIRKTRLIDSCFYPDLI